MEPVPGSEFNPFIPYNEGTIGSDESAGKHPVFMSFFNGLKRLCRYITPVFSYFLSAGVSTDVSDTSMADRRVSHCYGAVDSSRPLLSNLIEPSEAEKLANAETLARVYRD